MSGTDEERGILLWREIPDNSDDDSSDPDYDSLNLSMKTYDLPFVTNYLRKWKYSKYVPFLPTFDGFNDLKCCCKGSAMDFVDTEVVISASENEMNAMADEYSNKTESFKMKFSDQL